MNTPGTRALRAAVENTTIKRHLNRGPADSHCDSKPSLTGKFQIRSTVKCLSAITLAVTLWIPVSAQESWQTVDPKEALLKFENAERHSLKQSKDWQKTFELSEWTLDDGSIIYFHVTWMGPRWVLVKGGPSLEEMFRKMFPTAELVEVGEPFLNRERGTRGRAQWLRYRNSGSRCILIRQYGWDDDSQVTGRIPLGNRVAIGYRCTNIELTDTQIKELLERIDF